jgi:hypothetical protein
MVNIIALAWKWLAHELKSYVDMTMLTIIFNVTPSLYVFFFYSAFQTLSPFILEIVDFPWYSCQSNTDLCCLGVSNYTYRQVELFGSKKDEIDSLRTTTSPHSNSYCLITVPFLTYGCWFKMGTRAHYATVSLVVLTLGAAWFMADWMIKWSVNHIMTTVWLVTPSDKIWPMLIQMLT